MGATSTELLAEPRGPEQTARPNPGERRAVRILAAPCRERTGPPAPRLRAIELLGGADGTTRPRRSKLRAAVSPWLYVNLALLLSPTVESAAYPPTRLGNVEEGSGWILASHSLDWARG